MTRRQPPESSTVRIRIALIRLFGHIREPEAAASIAMALLIAEEVRTP
jgi:hypothetical protein